MGEAVSTHVIDYQKACDSVDKQKAADSIDTDKARALMKQARPILNSCNE